MSYITKKFPFYVFDNIVRNFGGTIDPQKLLDELMGGIAEELDIEGSNKPKYLPMDVFYFFKCNSSILLELKNKNKIKLKENIEDLCIKFTTEDLSEFDKKIEYFYPSKNIAN